MKTYLLLILVLSTTCLAADIDPAYQAKIVAAIYKIEGGPKTKWPFGIRSIDTGGDYSKAKRICENTVRNNYRRWNQAGRPGEFLEFLGNRYCPTSGNLSVAEKRLNGNWLKNLRAVMAKMP